MSANAPAAERARRRATQPAQPSRALVAFDPDAAKRDLVTQIRAPQRIEQFASLLGGDERMLERMLTVALHAATSNEKILKADPLTVIEAVREAMTLRLELTGVNGQGYLVPYWNRDKGLYDVQFQPGYRGLLDLVRRTGKVLDVQAEVAYEGDVLQWRAGVNGAVEYRAAWSDRGNRLGTIAWAYLPAPVGHVLKVIQLTESEAELIRKSSKAGDKGPWIDWPDEMRKKSALKRLCKMLPQDQAIERALAIESRAEERYSLPPAEAPRQLAGTARARAALGIPATTATAPAPAASDPTGDDAPPAAPQAQARADAPEAAPVATPVDEPAPGPSEAAGPAAGQLDEQDEDAVWRSIDGDAVDELPAEMSTDEFVAFLGRERISTEYAKALSDERFGKGQRLTAAQRAELARELVKEG